jgi:hypothetical protein
MVDKFMGEGRLSFILALFANHVDAFADPRVAGVSGRCGAHWKFSCKSATQGGQAWPTKRTTGKQHDSRTEPLF